MCFQILNRTRSENFFKSGSNFNSRYREPNSLGESPLEFFEYIYKILLQKSIKFENKVRLNLLLRYLNLFKIKNPFIYFQTQKKLKKYPVPNPTSNERIISIGNPCRWLFLVRGGLLLTSAGCDIDKIWFLWWSHAKPHLRGGLCRKHRTRRGVSRDL